MTLFSIDQKKCKRDGICAAECPAQIIVQVYKKSFPGLLENGEEFCITLTADTAWRYVLTGH